MLEAATKRADALMRYVTHGKRRAVVSIQGHDYLTYEAWATVARFCGCHVDIVRVVRVPETGPLERWEAIAVLLDTQTGQELCRATAECSKSEPRWNVATDNAVRSMAQTRAAAKVCRLHLSWIVVLAGYEATPSEEVQDMGPRQGHRRQVRQGARKDGRNPLEGAPPEFHGPCPACGSDVRWNPDGVSKKTGKPYKAFGGCCNRGCKNWWRLDSGWFITEPQ